MPYALNGRVFLNHNSPAGSGDMFSAWSIVIGGTGVVGVSTKSFPRRRRRLHASPVRVPVALERKPQHPLLLPVSSVPASIVHTFPVLRRNPSHVAHKLPVPAQLPASAARSEEHTSELQSLAYLVCRLLLE